MRSLDRTIPIVDRLHLFLAFVLTFGGELCSLEMIKSPWQRGSRGVLFVSVSRINWVKMFHQRAE
jgi:hypothetical protein